LDLGEEVGIGSIGWFVFREKGEEVGISSVGFGFGSGWEKN